MTYIRGRLRGIHVKLRVDRVIHATLPPEKFIGEIRDHFIDVHVDGDAATAAKNVNRTLIEMLARSDAG